MLPGSTHDWRLFVKPHELTFLLQTKGFLVDPSTFRGMAPTPSLRPTDALHRLRSGRLPRPPIGEFVEVASLEVNYLGWAMRRTEDGDADQGAPVGTPDQPRASPMSEDEQRRFALADAARASNGRPDDAHR